VKKNILLIPILALIVFAGCIDKISYTTSSDVILSFSTDTIQFDTVFNSIGSATKQFKIYNRDKKAIKTTVKLAGGYQSYYRLNIDGAATDEVDDLEIMGNDSAYVFVEVTVDPQNSNSPMVIADSILFYTNGNEQNVKLISYGQDVHLYNDSVIGSQTWINDKPYLIYNSILVDSLETLTIEPGVKVYFHPNSSLLVQGTLIVNGTNEQRVTFQGDRLEAEFSENPGQWGYYYKMKDGSKTLLGGIHLLRASKNNIINYAEIKNGIKGIEIDSIPVSDQPNLILSNSIIRNMSYAGIYAINTNLLVYNTVVANCGFYAVALSLGGHYEFYQSTIANYYSTVYRSSRKTQSLAFNNYFQYENKTYPFDFSAIFGNCIIWGELSEEFVYDAYHSDTLTVPFGFLFDHCMIKMKDDFDISNTDIYKDVITNKDSMPKFKDIYMGDFHLDTLSVAKDKGSTVYSTYFPLDLDGINRTLDSAPDLGAYEHIDNEEAH